MYNMLVDVDKDIGDVKEVKFRWNNHIVDIMAPKYGAAKVELQRAMDKKL